MRNRPGWTGVLAIGVVVQLATTSALSAQVTGPPNRGGLTYSMGIPSPWKVSAGFTAGIEQGEVSQATTFVIGSVYRDLLNPAMSGLGVLFEGYGGRQGSFVRFDEGWGGGVRLGLQSPAARLFVGGDYSFNAEEWDLLLSVHHPLKRGGVLADGGMFRVDYLPGRSHSIAMGFSFPVGDRFAGKTRAARDHVRLRSPAAPTMAFVPDDGLAALTTDARDRALWITRLTVPYVDQWDGDREDALEEFARDMALLRDYLEPPAGGGTGRATTPDEVVRRYHSDVERAFAVAAGEADPGPGGSTELGAAVWARGGEIILDQLVLPYNRLLGQRKRPDSTRGFAGQAAAAFYEWLALETPVDPARFVAVAWTFDQVLQAMEDVRALHEATWGDSRVHFLPFQLVLEPEEHDTQSELDALVARAVGRPWRAGNSVHYVENEQFQVEFARMVLEARDYSVLWIHDVRGLDGDGDPDEVAFRQVARIYLRALVDAVAAYGRTGKIPQHIVLLDQWYFETNEGRLFMELLENPLHHRLDLPSGFEEWEAEVRAVQAELRAAVEGSRLLQGQAISFPDGWIENLVKVHVNITNRADPSFWTKDVLPLIGLPDVVARDHRKIAFADLTEEDPFRGRAIYTGMGIGEHYVGAGWEDRALMVSGPAVLNLKAAARQVLLQQGFEAEEIPYELRPRPLADDYQARIDRVTAENDALARAMDIHNDIGFGQKDVNVVKAILYTLMPPGSVIKAPDSIWNLGLWGSMMLGNALRGGRSMVMPAALTHAPSSGFPQMSRSQELMARLVVAQEVLRPYLDRVGGLMKVGLYNAEMDAGNTPAKLRGVVANLRRTPWLRELYGIPDETLDRLERQADRIDAAGFARRYEIDQEVTTAKLHLKANFWATPDAWDGLLGTPEAARYLETYFDGVAELNVALSEGRMELGLLEERTDQLIPPGRAAVEAHREGWLEERYDRAALYLALGSHNQNSHSFSHAGEVAFMVAGWMVLGGLPDLVVLAGLSEWIDDLDELESLFPRYEGLKRRLGYWVRSVV